MIGPGLRTDQQRPLSLGEYASQARGCTDPATWDFIEGGAGKEQTLAANTRAFDSVRLRPRVLTGTSECDISATLLGRRWAAPLAVAPMAYHTLVHPDGETATVRAAGAAGVPVVVSTFAGRTFEDIAQAADSPLWLQVYCFRDRRTTRQLIERAEQAGFEALVLTVDTPQLGRRLRDLRSAFVLPSHVSPANLPPDETGYSSPSGHSRTALDASLDWSVITWLRSVSKLPVLLKGVMTGEDAVRAIGVGVDGIVVSNHGGRQLDGAPATLDVLAEVSEAVKGRCALLMDGGVRRGRDVLAAVAHGADAVLLGRPVLHGLAVGGQSGVAHVLDLVVDELKEAMLLTGTAGIADADRTLLSPPRVPPLRDAPPAVRTRPPSLSASAALHKEDLHGSVSDPVLDTMNFLNEITGRFPDAVSFAPGRPHEGFFDIEDMFNHIRRYIDHLIERGTSAADIRTAMYQYGPTAGIIRELIADSLRADESIDVTPESIVVTVGAQEGMLLTLRALCSGPDDVLLVASPCYVGITGAARLLDIQIRPVDERADGIDCTDLERAVIAEKAAGRRPRAFYLVPDHSNPSGSSMSRQARHDLLEVAARHDLLVLEDSPYRLVSPGARQPTLKSLDRDCRVIHIGSYSKTVFPAARIGFVIADQPVTDAAGANSLLADELAKIKSMVTVNTPALSQAAIAGALLAADGRLAEHNGVQAQHYGESLQVTLDQLERQFPENQRRDLGISWNTPTGGFFLTVRVPFDVNNTVLLRSAAEHGVIWTPMAYFYPEAGGDRTIRLSFSYLSHEEIEEGIARFAAFLRAETSRGGVPLPLLGCDA
ncbi:aminotransferase class I/II-fold pyridoxal phosphate-dependent enzyme [Streptomyces sp. SID4931]|nr:aminotransferase class I/II-fold pyridoxal phosphate-dependent enzyme [Streptomyces sp. SID4931]SCF61750.1 (S)-3,5-dihydroxyphenylglycine transaminase [Streptomyces sp. Ncost-T6T-2b]